MHNKMNEFKLCLYIKEFNTIINTEISEKLKHKGLTQSQITAIKFVAHKKKITLTELSEMMSIKKSTCSGIVDRLEAMDIFERVRDEKDKRISYVKFSERGKILADEIKDDMNGVFVDIFKDVPKETLDIVGSKLQEIMEIIKK